MNEFATHQTKRAVIIRLSKSIPLLALVCNTHVSVHYFGFMDMFAKLRFKTVSATFVK